MRKSCKTLYLQFFKDVFFLSRNGILKFLNDMHSNVANLLHIIDKDMSFPMGYDMYMHGTSEAISFSQFPNLQNLIPNQFPAWRGQNKIPNLFPISQPRGNPGKGHSVLYEEAN